MFILMLRLLFFVLLCLCLYFFGGFFNSLADYYFNRFLEITTQILYYRFREAIKAKIVFELDH